MLTPPCEWKQKFSERSDAEMALATQFAFEAGPIIEWANAVKAAGVDIPIHIGIAGPAKLQTLIRFAIACGVGASLKVLQKRAMDVTKLLLPYEPTRRHHTAGRVTKPKTQISTSLTCIFSHWAGSRRMPTGRSATVAILPPLLPTPLKD